MRLRVEAAGDVVGEGGVGFEVTVVAQTDEGAVLIGEGVVHAPDDHVVIEDVLGIARVVVQSGGGSHGVRRGVIGLNRFGDRVDPIRWNDVALERSAAESPVGGYLRGRGVVYLVLRTEGEKGGKIAVPFGGGGDGADVRRGLAPLVAFPTGEEECLIPSVVELGNAHRPAERGAIAVVLIFGLRAAGRVLEKSGSVQSGVDHVLVQFAVILVGAALGDRVENRSGSMANGGIEARSLHLEFRDGVLRQLKGDQRIAAAVEERIGHSVDRVFVGVEGVAVGGELRRGAVEAAFALPEIGRVDNARGEQHKLIGITRLKWKILDLSFFDHLAQCDI